MVAIRPFAALRYDPSRAGRLDEIIAPPYDVIDAALQDQLYARSPYNVVRLTLGKQFAQDTEQHNRYTRTRQDFLTWQRQGILRQDPVPALYIVEHAFESAGQRCARLGFIALVELRDPIEQVVYRHEATLAAPKADRAKLLETVPVQCEPIFCVFPDPGQTIYARCRQLTQGAPTLQTTGTDQVRVWAITAAEQIQTLTDALSRVAVLIADGHHRFEVAWANRARWPAVMTYFASIEDPALVLGPIHRLVGGTPDLTRLQALCLMTPAGALDALTRWLSESDDQRQSNESSRAVRFGLYDGRTLYQAQVREAVLQQWLHAPTVPRLIAGLDVAVLHGLVLPSIGFNGHRQVQYMADSQRVLDAVDRGEGGCAWLLRPLPLQRVYELAAKGLTLPPKSTFFYPKIPSGLAMHLLA